MQHKIKKECLNFTENLLRNYNNIQAAIERMEKDLVTLEDDVASLPALQYGTDKVQTSVSGSPTEDSAILVIKEKEKIEKELSRNKNLINAIDKGMNNLSELHREIIKLFFIEGNEWVYISDKLKYSERALRRKKNQAVKDIAVTIYGYRIIEMGD